MILTTDITVGKMSDLATDVHERLLAAIDDQMYSALASAQRLRDDSDHRQFAFLFDRAAAFWQQLAACIAGHMQLTGRQEFVAGFLREPIERDALAEQKRVAA